MTKNRIAGQIQFLYDRKNDVLDTVVDRNTPVRFEEIGDGICLMRDTNTNLYCGFIIVDYMRRIRDGLLHAVPNFEDVELPRY